MIKILQLGGQVYKFDIHLGIPFFIRQAWCIKNGHEIEILTDKSNPGGKDFIKYLEKTYFEQLFEKCWED